MNLFLFYAVILFFPVNLIFLAIFLLSIFQLIDLKHIVLHKFLLMLPHLPCDAGYPLHAYMITSVGRLYFRQFSQIRSISSIQSSTNRYSQSLSFFITVDRSIGFSIIEGQSRIFNFTQSTGYRNGPLFLWLQICSRMKVRSNLYFTSSLVFFGMTLININLIFLSLSNEELYIGQSLTRKIV